MTSAILNTNLKHSKDLEMAYQRFILSKQDCDKLKTKFIIDFDKFQFLEDGTGYANIWIQPIRPVLLNPKIGSIGKVEVSGIIITPFIEVVEGKCFFVIDSSFNPSAWNGRKKLRYNDNSKILVTGIKRISKNELHSDCSPTFFIENFNRLLIETFAFYFIN